MSTEPKSTLTRTIQRAAKIEPGEGAAVVTAFLLYFCVLGGYFAVRPVRETVGTILGPERTADLFVVTWIASVAIVPIYGSLCARFRRSVFLPWIYGFVALSLATIGVVLRATESVFASQFFYVLISVLNLFVVSVLWSFLLELFNAGQVKRLFGIIAACGTAGALVGPMLTDITVRFIGNDGVLFMGATMFVIAIVCQRILLGIWKRTGWSVAESGAPASGASGSGDRPMGGNPFAGFTLILKSPYLIGIATFVVLAATANTFLYFAQLRLVAETFPDEETRTQVFSRIDYTVQSLTIIAQIFFTGRIASKWGIGSLLMFVPMLMVAGFLTLSALYTFPVLVAVMITRRVGEYSFVRPGREMLFSRVDTETKYKAKNAIDVPVYRGGDAVIAQVDSVLDGAGWSPASLALLGAGGATLWAINGVMLARSKQGMEGRSTPAPATS